MKETRYLTCIVCPVGCRLTVEMEDGKVLKVSGNECKRGGEYARKECVNPVRTLTTTVRVDDGRLLSIRSAEPLPKDLIFPCMATIDNLAVVIGSGIEVGDVVIPNICDSGIDMIATKSLFPS